MNKSITRVAKIDDWFFEVKMVRAIKSKNYGDSYSAVAQLTANGESMHIDSHLSVDDTELTKDDFMTIYKFCQSMGMKSISYDRVKNGLRTSKRVEVSEEPIARPNMRLVK
ncbi:hypothetical protein [Paraglaciecola aestuariivivens]